MDANVIDARRMISVGFVLLVEAYRSVGVNTIEALDRVAALGEEVPDGQAPPEQVPTPSDNDLALMELQKMMGGLA